MFSKDRWAETLQLFYDRTHVQLMTVKQSARNVLRKEQVLEIFKRKMCDIVGRADWKSLHSQPDASKVGKEFGVTAKAVRDIWTGRTWYRETLHLDPARPDARERLSKHVGRPKGSKDKKPRRQKESGIIGNVPISPPQITIDPTAQSIRRIVTVRDSLNGGSIATMQDGSDLGTATSVSFLDTSGILGLDALMSENYINYACAEFLDPFHDDWPFWTSKNEVDTVTPSFQVESTISQH